ncbi:hypothetical protein PoB_003169100, partial [Plakobranchus ocellatus]
SFRGVDGSSGGAVGYQVRGPSFESQSGPSQFFIASLCPPGTKLVARSLTVKKPYTKNNQDPTPDSPMLGLRLGPTLLTFTI